MQNTRLTPAQMFAGIGAALFIWSELSKDPKERVLLSRDSKIASAIGELLSL